MKNRELGSKKGNTTVIVIRDGVAKELNGLSESMEQALKEAYDKEPIRGLSRESYRAMNDMLMARILEYQRLVKANEEIKSIAFANAMDIYSNESPLLIDLLAAIDSLAQNNSEFSSKNINMKNMINMLEALNKQPYKYSEVNRDFKEWAKELFKFSSLKIGVVRFCKYYYSISTTAVLQA